MRNKISVILKLVVVVCAVWGVLLCVASGADSFMGSWNALKFFTIQSNIWVALAEACGVVTILKKKTPSKICNIIKLMVTVAITLTGFVFCFILAPTFPGAWILANVLTHVIVPIASVLDFLVYDAQFAYQKKWCFTAAILPVYYVIFAAYGYAQNWEFMPGVNYPYFFLNWGSPAGVFGFCKGLPFIGVGYWILIGFVFVTLVALLYIALANIGKKKKS